MNKILKNIDIKLFIICIFIIAGIGIYARNPSTPYVQTSEVHSNRELTLKNSYITERKIVSVCAEIFIITFVVWCGFFFHSKIYKKKNNNTEEIQSNLKQYILRLERTNKDLIETKEELNQQHELFNRIVQKLKSTDQRYNMVLENASIGIFEWDITENTVTISDWTRDILRLKNNTISSKEFLELMPEEYRERHVNNLYEYIERKKGSFNVEEKYRLKDGSYEWFEINAKGVFDKNGLMIKICGSIENINDKKLNSEKIKRLEYTDYLTELPNKIAFQEKFNASLVNRDYKNKVFMFLVDVDDLGIVNNEVGNTIGDEVLKAVAARIKGSVSENNYIARIGGDEFVILDFNIYNIDAAHNRAIRIIKEFEKPFIIGDERYYITASMGIVVAPDDGLDYNFLVKNATEAMYKAKEIGKNTYSFYTESINKEIIKKLDTSNDLKKAIEKNEFFLTYQPQYNIITGRILGFETLLRWKHPSKGIIYPIEFLSVAEESGLIVPIGEKVIRQACKQAEDWAYNGFNEIEISINISSRQFNDKNFYNFLKNISNTLKLAKIKFEISNNIIFQDTTYAINMINKIQQLGFKFSIHNVGSDLVSALTVKDLPIKSIKLERNFIISQLQTQIGRDIIKTFIRFAHSMGYEIVAEGVEEDEQVQFFKENDCNIAQGYYFSKPITDIQADELLEREFLI